MSSAYQEFYGPDISSIVVHGHTKSRSFDHKSYTKDKLDGYLLKRFRDSRKRLESHTEGVHINFTEALFRVADDLDEVERFYTDFTSTYEGFGVLHREVTKLWECVKTDTSKDQMAGYATSVAVMAIKFLMDLC